MKGRVLDILHRSVVTACVATTIVGTGFLGYKVARLVLVVWPERQKERERLQKELLREGRSDNLPDIAPTLKG